MVERSSGSIRSNRTYLALGVLAIVLATWPIDTLRPQTGIDPSWEAALHLVSARGIDLGSELITTYGPLGFLVFPQHYFVATAVAGVLWLVALQAATVSMLLRFLRPQLPRWATWGLAYLGGYAVWTVPPAERLTLVMFLLCLAAIQERGVANGPRRAALLGIVAAVGLLIKVNVGLATGALGLFAAAWMRPARRAVPSFLLSHLSAFLILWLALGQRFSDVTPFLRAQFELATGYAAAIGIEHAPGTDLLLAAFAAAIFVRLLVVCARSGRSDLRAVLGLGAILLLFIFKHAFVRHDNSSIAYFGATFVASLALVPRISAPRQRWTWAMFATALLVPVVTASLGPLWVTMNPLLSVHDAVVTVSEVSDNASRGGFTTRSRSQVRSFYRIDAAALDLIDNGDGVHIDPYAVQVAWAYPEIRWQPVPVFHSFFAYTPYLDDLNSRALSGDGPGLVLRARPESLEERNPVHDSPRYMLSMFCHFDEIYASERWQVLKRNQDRCGEPQLISETDARWGEEVLIPQREDELVYVTLDGLRPSLWTSVTGLLYKPGPWYMEINDAFRYRFVPSNASQPMVVHVPSNGNYSGEFAFPETYRSLSIHPPQGLDGGGPVVRFYGVAVDPP